MFKLLDLDNVDKYFAMAGMPFYKVKKYHGDIRVINGTAKQEDGDVEEFTIELDHNDIVNVTIGNKTVSI
jgi:hypothetical protein